MAGSPERARAHGAGHIINDIASLSGDTLSSYTYSARESVFNCAAHHCCFVDARISAVLCQSHCCRQNTDGH